MGDHERELTTEETSVEPEAPTSEILPAPTLGEAHLKAILESLIFVADQPVAAKQLARATGSKTADIRRLMVEVIEGYKGRGIEITEVADGYQFRSALANAPWVRDFMAHKPVRLTRAQLETLAILAYRQPVTRPEVDEIRGVDTGSSLKVLLERGLVKILGRKEEPGRPLLYGTTPEFLEFFGLRSLKDLPTLKEFTDLSDESKALFTRKTGEELDLASINAEVEKVLAGTTYADDAFDDEDDGADEIETTRPSAEQDPDDRSRDAL